MIDALWLNEATPYHDTVGKIANIYLNCPREKEYVIN